MKRTSRLTPIAPPQPVEEQPITVTRPTLPPFEEFVGLLRGI
jgi:hypothetical protein